MEIKLEKTEYAVVLGKKMLTVSGVRKILKKIGVDFEIIESTRNKCVISSQGELFEKDRIYMSKMSHNYKNFNDEIITSIICGHCIKAVYHHWTKENKEEARKIVFKFI